MFFFIKIMFTAEILIYALIPLSELESIHFWWSSYFAICMLACYFAIHTTRSIFAWFYHFVLFSCVRFSPPHSTNGLVWNYIGTKPTEPGSKKMMEPDRNCSGDPVQCRLLNNVLSLNVMTITDMFPNFDVSIDAYTKRSYLNANLRSRSRLSFQEG